MFKNTKDQLAAALREITDGGMHKEEKVISGWQGPEIKVEGKTYLNFCANNYLGLAGSKELVEVAKQAFDHYGFGMASVRFICGTSTIHKALEAGIAKFFGAEDAILYGSCFDANAGLFETLTEAGDAIFSDELNHASIIDGIRLSKADRFRYKHSDMADLKTQLASAGARRRKLIVTDGVFSMDGEIGKLKEICDLADEYDALVVVDDSHASGVLGKTGRGSIEAQNVMSRIDILTSTFGKALGGASGGFTAGKKEIIAYLRERSRPYLFSNTMPTVVAATALYVLENFDTKLAPLRKTLEENTAYFRKGMEKLKFQLGGDGLHPIMPVMIMDELKTMAMANDLFQKGIYVRGFTYPVVAKGKARIRVQISAAHTRKHLDQALKAFAEIGRKNKLIA